MIDLKNKLYRNALVAEKLVKLTKPERQKVVLELSKDYTERELAFMTGIPRSTLNDWKTLRQSNKGEHIHVSLSLIYRKLKHLKAVNITNWGRIEQIKDVCEDLLKQR